MPRKGYRAKSGRTKFPLDVQAQRKLIKKAEGKEKTLLILMLSTGIHPKVLAHKRYGLEWDKRYYRWLRVKTMNEVMGAWSKAMRENGVLSGLVKLRGLTPQRLWQIVEGLGQKVKIKGLCPLQLRHTSFVNRARLKHDVFSISQGAGTDLTTVANYYMIGLNESKSMSKEDRTFLRWLMEA